MNNLKESIDNLSLPVDITGREAGYSLSWAESTAGFEIFDLKEGKDRKTAIGDDADYLYLFMAVSNRLFSPGREFGHLLIASDTGGKRLFLRYYIPEEMQEFKYAYIALGHAAKQLPESVVNGKFTFFAEVAPESASKPAFEKEAMKAARSMSGETREAWESLIAEKADFLKTDLYVFHLLKLYSWGFNVIKKNGDVSSKFHFVRAKRPKPRGVSRH